MIHLSVPVEGNYGWAVCGRNLSRAVPQSVVVPLANSTPIVVPETVLHGISGPTFAPFNPNIWSRNRNIGLAFIEDIETADKYREYALRHYDLVLTGSSWCTEKLRGLGIPARTMIQGVDSFVFYPTGAPKAQSRFMIFSGGKAEYRKGTDVVIAAFKEILHTIPDAHLICAWGNYWPDSMHTLSKSSVIAYYPHSNDWQVNMRAVMTDNGIPEDRYSLLDIVSNYQMAAVYRSCHVGLFPNRCEAGTNLVMMEAMACGLPVIATTGTGHWDVLDLNHIFPIAASETESGWLEPDVSSVVGLLSAAYLERERLPDIGRKCYGDVFRYTWGGAAAIVEEVCMQTCVTQPVKPLTKREQKVLEMLIAGSSNKQISETLGVAAGAISEYKSSLKEKFKVSNDTQLGIAIAKGGLR